MIGEKKSKNGKKQAFLWVFCPFSGNFRGIATDSDSVIRWFESSYPSQFDRYYRFLIVSIIFYCAYLFEINKYDVIFWEVGSDLGSFWEVIWEVVRNSRAKYTPIFWAPVAYKS